MKEKGTQIQGERLQRRERKRERERKNLLGLLNKILYGLGALLVEQRLADLNIVQDLLEGEGHASANDDLIDAVDHVVDQLNLIGDLGSAQQTHAFRKKRASTRNK